MTPCRHSARQLSIGLQYFYAIMYYTSYSYALNESFFHPFCTSINKQNSKKYPIIRYYPTNAPCYFFAATPYKMATATAADGRA